MLLDGSKFVVKAQTKAFSSKKSFEILDGDSGQVVGSAKDITGFVSSLLGSTVMEVRDAGGAVAFTVSRTGFLLSKDQVLDGQGAVVGRYKAKIFSLSGGFNISDKDGKPLAEIQGKMMKAEYKFVAPDKSEMGSVSRTWGGLAKSLFTGSGTYGVQVAQKYANDAKAKMLMLGATIAIETIYKKKAGKSGGGSGGDAGGGEE